MEKCGWNECRWLERTKGSTGLLGREEMMLLCCLNVLEMGRRWVLMDDVVDLPFLLLQT